MSSPPRIKICGLTRSDDVRLVAELGGWAVGFVFDPASPRAVSARSAEPLVRQARAAGLQAVGVFVNASADELRAGLEAGLTQFQLHGDESPADCERLRGTFPGYGLIKALRPRLREELRVIGSYRPHCEAVLLDAHVPGARGGTGRTGDWTLAEEAALTGPVILAGGLKPENIAAAMRIPGLYGVDASSGLEDSPGIKSADKLRQFFENAKEGTHG